MHTYIRMCVKLFLLFLTLLFFPIGSTVGGFCYCVVWIIFCSVFIIL